MHARSADESPARAAPRSAAEPPVQRRAARNNTGLPDSLKSGVEHLSGLSLDGVRVHRNSAKPAQLNAHAFAQGTDIHLAPGQEKHLPHEAWHVVQQAQGRVRPTTQLQSAVPVNDDPSLEREADRMGARAATVQRQPAAAPDLKDEPFAGSFAPAPVAQLVRGPRGRGGSRAYASLTFTGGLVPTVRGTTFARRPPSNSRRGQGDHVVAYSLITQAMHSSVMGKTVVNAGAALADLVRSSAEFVADAPTNNWWHTEADTLEHILDGLSPARKDVLNTAFNRVAILLNAMPGGSRRNARSRGGHGEGGSRGGLVHAERQVNAHRVVAGNIWTNVLNLFDATADPGVVADDGRLASKLSWLLALFQRAAPTVYEQVEAGDRTYLTGTDLRAAVRAKFAAARVNFVVNTIQDWLDA